ncbi:putative methionyl-tRNA synthetase [Hordeum vulgare]|nr:putative methionyl-tRNA synthetase [Hordeum vulgare]
MTWRERGYEEEEGEDEEEVIGIEEEAFAAVARPAVRSANYREAEDILLVRAWTQVGMDASTGTDQTGKRYWQRIEDSYCKIKTKTGGYISSTYRSLQGRWELMKPQCARWSAAMDQVKDAPPSGTVESDYETIAGLRYKEMAAFKGKAFSFKHAWAILQTFDKCKLRDQEIAPKKAAMLRMDDSDEEERNLCKPEGTKKDNLRKKMEGEASSIREKMEHMTKSRETLIMKTLETKLLIIDNKKEVKLAQVEARREEVKRKDEERGIKADLEERMIKVKEAKSWKELMVEEKEHMMMYKKDMDEDQLMWWKDYKEDIAERKRIFRGASSTL